MLIIKNIMNYKCSNCGYEFYHEELVNKVFEIEGKTYLINKIPAKICDRCSDRTFSSDTYRDVFYLIHSKKPKSKVLTDVFEFT
jgi:HTH-type transcriptional regulator / antitoxin MqsA